MSLLVLVATLAASDGAFGYSLDDPYIHLAMAEEILAGNYGINAGETAAASSSIVYPFLIAGLLAAGAGALAPLIVTGACTVASVLLAVAIFSAAGLPGPRRLSDRAFLVPAIFVLVANLVGLAFTGMEHSLHLAATMAALLGAVRFTSSGRVDAWWLVILIVQPLIRYEGLGVAFAGALILFLRGRVWSGLAVCVAAGLIVAGFGTWLMSQGLPPLPSSVMVKGSDVAGASGIAGKAAAFLDNFSQNVSEQSGFIFLVLAIMFATVSVAGLRRSRHLAQGQGAGPAALIALFVAVILVGHLFAGRFGWAQRYEAYAFIAALVALPVVFRDRAIRFLEGRDAPILTLSLIILLLAFAPNVRATLESPEGSRNIFLQQRQMHRLAADYVKSPVAVNDLGWVSYQNPQYVLDLWGLGSEKAREARSAGQGPGWMSELATERGVKLVMIYDAWLPELPAGWVRLGSLTFRGKLVTAAEREVAMYATEPGYVPELNAAIAAWSASLSKRAKFSPDTYENPTFANP